MPIRVKKAKLNNLIKQLKELDGKHIRSGILEQDGSQVWQSGNNNPITLAGIGYIQEFGLNFIHTGGHALTVPRRGESFYTHIPSGTEINIPERSFIRIPLMDVKSETKKIVKESFVSIISGKSISKHLNVIGKHMEKTIKGAITGGSYAPLSDWAIARKGSSRPLTSLQKYIKHEVI